MIPEQWDYETDVVIVGGGGAGLAAAVEASSTGARVLVLEACPQLGGTTGMAVGSFTAAGTKYQRAAGIDDDPAWHAEDMAKFAPPQHEARNNAALRGLLAREAAKTQEWLEGLGLEFQGPKPESHNRVPRMHNVIPNGKAYVEALQARALSQGTEIRTGRRVTRLYRQERVVGVGAGGWKVRATRGVILAAGDYSNGRAVKSDYVDPDYAFVEGINPSSKGDGHRLARQVGAALLNMEIVYGPELRFIDSWWHPERSLFEKGAILVDSEGRRFTVDERMFPEFAIPLLPDKIAYILLDRNLAEIFSAWPNFISTAPQISYAYIKDYARLRPDVYAESSDLADLARRIGAEPAVLAKTVSLYNWSPPFYLLGPVKSGIVTTEGGVAINDKMEALDHQGRVVIPGLYAAGSNGMGGVVVWGHGLHIAWATTSGRIAGRNAACA